jgi:hypothetical protein
MKVMKNVTAAVALLGCTLAAVETAHAGSNLQKANDLKINTGQRMSESIRVVVNGETVHFEDQEPRMTNNRVYVPLRGVFERMGAEVEWKADERKVQARHNGRIVELWIDRTTAKVEGRDVALDAPPRIMNGRTMVPLRFISESLGADVHWRGEDWTVLIQTGDRRLHP